MFSLNYLDFLYLYTQGHVGHMPYLMYVCFAPQALIKFLQINLNYLDF